MTAEILDRWEAIDEYPNMENCRFQELIVCNGGVITSVPGRVLGLQEAILLVNYIQCINWKMGVPYEYSTGVA